MKTWKKIARLLFILVVVIPTAAAVAVQIPAVQTALVGKVTDTLSEKLDGSVHVGKVYFSFPNNIILRDIDIIHGACDTVAHVGKILANVSTPSLVFSNHAHIRRISVEDGQVAMRRLDNSTTNLKALLAPMLKDRKKSEGPLNLPWDAIRADRVNLKNINFSADSIDVRDLNLSLRDIRYDGNLTARIEQLTLEERVRDIHLDRLDGIVTLDGDGLQVQDFHFNDRNSQLTADVGLGFADFADFSDFPQKVRIDASLHNSLLDLQTLRSVLGDKIPALALWLDGRVTGTLSDLRSDRIHVQSDTQGTAADLRFRLKGLPDLNHTYINAEIAGGRTSTADLAEILAGINPSFKKSSISKFAPGEPISLHVQAVGTLANLQLTGRIDTKSMGAAALDGNLHLKNGQFGMEGTLGSETLQLGRVLGISSIGPLTCHTGVSFASSKNNLTVDVESLHIDRFSFNGYEYHDIAATALLDNGHLAANLLSGDPNLQLRLHSDVDLGGKGKSNHYLVDLDLDYADLDALFFDKRDSTSLRLALDADILQTPEGAFLGEATIQDMEAMLGDRRFPIGNLKAVSTQHEFGYNLGVDADILKADYDGNIFVADFIKEALHIVMEDNIEHLFGSKHSREEDESHPEQYGSLRLLTLNLQPLFDFFKPGLFVSPQTSVSLDLISDEVQGGVSSELVALDNHFLRNLQGRFYTMGEQLLADFDVDRMQLGGLTAENVTLDAVSDSSRVDLRASFLNEDGSGNRASLNTRVNFADPQQEGYLIQAKILPSEITLANHTWRLTPATIQYRDKHIQIHDFALRSGGQSLLADGVVGTECSDTLRVKLNDFDISMANAFLAKNLDLQGNLTGEGEGFALLGEGKGILLDIFGREIFMAGVELGDLHLNSHWDDPNAQFLFLAESTLEGRHPLNASASYRPANKQATLDARLDKLAMGIVAPLLDGIASDITGTVSGHLKASGPLNKLAIESEGTRFNQLGFLLDYTKVRYVADGPFTVGSTGVTFDGIDLTDPFGQHGKLTGGVPYDHFKNLTLNARIDLRNMQVLNTTAHDNSTFYGQAFANGQVRLMGPLNKVRLGLTLTTQPNTAVHIPVGNSAKERTSLLTFINNENDRRLGLIDSIVQAKQTVKEKGNKGNNDLNVSLRLNATPDGEILLEIDRNSGDILKARGNGQIGITAGNHADFTIQGDYRVESGNYHFGMLGITARDFSINPGGTIGFNGDVMDSDLNLTANYRTKASISPLIADSTAVSTRRAVICGIQLTGKLANPQISFKIDIPDLDPTTQSMVESALNSEDKRMKQALALLVSGGFVPDEQSGIVNSSTMLYSNASEMMASQLNNIFHQLDIPLDLGFNYQPTEDGRNIFDVAVSTQLFNNRVSINGNIGNRQYYSSSNSDIVGDIDVEIKLNKSGQLRLTLFSHSADQYSNYLDQSQRNGAGIVYQEDFNSFRELWRKIFHIKGDERQAPPGSDPARRPRPE